MMDGVCSAEKGMADAVPRSQPFDFLFSVTTDMLASDTPAWLSSAQPPILFTLAPLAGQ